MISGRDLRHLPVIVPENHLVRVTLRGLPEGDIDVSDDHVPVSLRPLVIGVRLDVSSAEVMRSAGRLALAFYDHADAKQPVASIDIRPIGEVPVSRGSLRLFRTVGCHNRTAPIAKRWFRYVLAWRRARTAARRGDRLCMSASDLRCLNVYYIAARPVYLIGVMHDTRTNVFPMDLVGPLSSGDFTLALRATSPSIALMEASRRIAMSGAPAKAIDCIYALGAHHHKLSVELDDVPLAFTRSAEFALPILAEPGLVRELSVREVHRVGSHVLFLCTVVREAGHTHDQLAHMSGMYAEWLSRRGIDVRAVEPSRAGSA